MKALRSFAAMRMHRIDAYLVTGLVAIGLLVKLLWSGRNELAHDEPFTVYWALQSWKSTMAMLRDENNPPLFFAIMHGWSRLVPLEAAYLRIPSALFSAVAVWPVFLIARRLDGRRTALIAALLFTFSNYHYGFAHEVRAYALFTLLAICSMWLLVREMDRGSRTGRVLFALALVDLIMVYTHFLGWAMVGVQFVCVLLVAEMKPLRGPFLRSLGIVLLGYLPYMAILRHRLGISVSEGTWLTPPVPEEIYNMIWRWSNVPVLAVLSMLVIGIGAWRTRLSDASLRIAVLWSLLPLLGMFLISLVVPVFLDRYLVFAAPGYALLFATALGKLGLPLRLSVWPGAAAVGIMAVTFTPWKPQAQRPSAVVAQRSTWQEGILVIDPDWYVHTWTWASGQLACFRAPLEERAKCLGDGQVLVSTPGALPFDPQHTEQVVLIDAGSRFHDPSGSTKALLRRNFPKVDSVQADHAVMMYRFHR